MERDGREQTVVGRIVDKLDRMPKVCGRCGEGFEGGVTEGQQADGTYRCPRCR